jgi:predicted NBD/HSP70 family sugar kinase
VGAAREAGSPGSSLAGAGPESGATPAPAAPDPAELVREAVRRQGADPAARRFLADLAERIALGVAAVVSVLDPGCVVLAGEIGRAGGDTLAARVHERLARLSPLPTEVRPSLLGGEAVLRGALLTARDRAQEEVFARR